MRFGLEPEEKPQPTALGFGRVRGVEIPQTNGMAVMRNLELAESTLLSSLNSFEYKIDDIEKKPAETCRLTHSSGQ